ncbi:tetratricopeptide repeat protein [Shouchella hunanensis]|uniref:Tetratricopeptide repeat protein n=1 Tax=Shouchella hunanensis TaxID=766894 RepID=A0ABY7VZK1_9BACI|nr:tetratricopeptide repeat protein [Shouchella hunanensis]WDF02153.1 tetratricopeptide repeat protein [Shouchella hunanensis]
MSDFIRSEIVGAKIVEWYSCIIARSVDQAIQLQAEIKDMLKKMEESDQILAYYSLVEYRFNMMMNQTTDKEAGDEMFNRIDPIVKSSMDNLLHYYYYFISGQHEFLQEHYRSAIKLFRKAERLLEYVKDDAEEAEFHYYMGSALQRINQYVFASSYLEDAIVTFKRLKYTEKVIFSYNIMAGLFSETDKYEKANDILQENLVSARNYPVAEIIVLRMLGINEYRYNNYSAARGYYENVLKKMDKEAHPLVTKTKYNLALTLFKLDEKEYATVLLEEGLKEAVLFNMIEFISNCNILKGLYLDEDLDLIDHSLQTLKDNSLYFEAEELADELALYFEEQNRLELSVKYLREAYSSKKNLLKLGVD